ncbi:MAG: cyanophycinase [Planctomycetaceae bacterium]|nr:cyanophycinase [Planctomycetaceae bacterium]
MNAVIVKRLILLTIAVASSNFTVADEKVPPPRIDHEGIRGRLILVGGGTLPDIVVSALKEAVGDDGHLVLIPDAADQRAAAVERDTKWLSDAGIQSITALPEPESSDDWLDLAAREISRASAVWIGGGQQSRLAGLYAGTSVEVALQDVLTRGGTIAGTSAGAAIMSKTMIASGNAEPVMSTGLDLLPNAIVDQHFTQRQREPRSRKAVADHPGHFGIGIDEGTAVIVEGRHIFVAGDGAATVLLPACGWRAAEEYSLRNGERADLTQLRRAAISRASSADPSIPDQDQISVPRGALIIVGGGGMPTEIVDRFLQLAGGSDAHIVCLPTAVPREMARRQRLPGFLADARVASVVMLPHSRTDEIQSAEFQEALKRATGIWFGGGRQWNFVDAYNNTSAMELFRDVLNRGGVIAGSSAGATIQGDFLVRGHPLGNTVMMAEGYEAGFAFLPGTAIDQHFTQRGRQPDLLPVIARNPRYLGIGIDEATAIVVQGSNAEVIGQHAAHFLSQKQLPNAVDVADLPQTPEEAAALYVTAKSGQTIDLQTLSVTYKKDANNTVPCIAP